MLNDTYIYCYTGSLMSDHPFYLTIFVVEEDDASVSEVAVERWSQSIKADGEETRQSSPVTPRIVCESRRQSLFSRQSSQQ